MAIETTALPNPAVASMDEVAQQLSADISAKQQASVPIIPTAPAIQLTDELEKTVNDVQKEAAAGSGIPAAGSAGTGIGSTGTNSTIEQMRLLANKTQSLTDQLTKDLQINTGKSEDEAKVQASAISVEAAANAIITLQAATEANRIEDKLIRVTAQQTSEANQSRLMTQAHDQAQDYQVKLDEMEAEAAEGGFGYLLKSALNMEIYGTPGGRDDIELKALSSQYNATVTEIQGITTAVDSFESDNLKTQDLITNATILAGQEQISAKAAIDLSNARIAGLARNAESMGILLNANKQGIGALKSILDAENSIAARRDAAAARILAAERFELDKQLGAERLIALKLSNEDATLRNAINASDAGLEAQSRARLKILRAQLKDITLRNDENVLTSASRVATIIGKRDVQVEQLATLKQDFKIKEDKSPLELERLKNSIIQQEQNIEASNREALFEEAVNPLRIEEAKQLAVLRTQQQELNRLNIIIANGTQEQKIIAINEKNQLEAQMAGDERLAVESSATSIDVAMKTLFGVELSPEELRTAARETGEAGARFDVLENIGNTLKATGKLRIGETAHQSWLIYQGLTANGATMRDLPFIEALQEVNNRLELKYADDPQIRPTDPEIIAADFNREADEYTHEFSNNIKTGDSTNPAQADPFPILEKKAPELKNNKVFKLISAAGQIEQSPEKAIDIAVNNIGGALTLEEAADGIFEIYSAAGYNSTNFDFGLSAAGFDVPISYKVLLDSPLTSQLDFNTFPSSGGVNRITGLSRTFQKRVRVDLMNRSQIMLFLTQKMSAKKFQGKKDGAGTQEQAATAAVVNGTGGEE